MVRNAQQILDDALILPVDQRAELAQRIMASLDDQFDPAVKEAWSQEIARRVRELDEGKAPMISGDEVRRRIDQHLQARGIRHGAEASR